jgi:hypothetical protein
VAVVQDVLGLLSPLTPTDCNVLGVEFWLIVVLPKKSWKCPVVVEPGSLIGSIVADTPLKLQKIQKSVRVSALAGEAGRPTVPRASRPVIAMAVRHRFTHSALTILISLLLD